MPAVSNRPISKPAAKRKVLHIACGPKQGGNPLHENFSGGSWREVRMDENPTNFPDVVGSLRTLHQLLPEQYDAIYVHHDFANLYLHEIPAALKELHRVLTWNGFAFIIVPDIQRLAEGILDGRLESRLYDASTGPITVHDIVFGYWKWLQQGQTSAERNTGFSARPFSTRLKEAGFADIRIERKGIHIEAIVRKLKLAEDKEPVVRVIEDDINNAMRRRDELDKEPEMWKGFPPK